MIAGICVDGKCRKHEGQTHSDVEMSLPAKIPGQTNSQDAVRLEPQATSIFLHHHRRNYTRTPKTPQKVPFDHYFHTSRPHLRKSQKLSIQRLLRSRPYLEAVG